MRAGKKKKKKKIHGNRTLTIEEEEAVLSVASAFALNNEPMTEAQLVKLIRKMKGITSKNGGREIARRLMKERRDVFKSGAAKSLSKSRYNEGLLGRVDKYIDLMEEEQDDARYAAHQRVNADEFIASVTLQGSSIKRLVLRSQPKHSKRRGVRGSAPSILPFVSADGVCLCCFVFVVAEQKNGEWYVKDLELPRNNYEMRGDIKFFYIPNATGKVTKEEWPMVVEKFIKVWKERYGELECRLQIDGLDFHKSFDSVKLLFENMIRCIFPPGGTTTFLQPLDDVLYGTLKNVLTSTVEQSFEFQLDKDTKYSTLLTEIIPLLVQRVFTKNLVKAAFRNTGVCPWDPDLIKKKRKNFCGTVPQRYRCRG